jgi:hypothetical protein
MVCPMGTEVVVIVGCGAIMAVVWSGVLWHVRNGNRNRWLTWMVAMLILANFG